MIWAIVFLAVMNIATGLTIVYHRNYTGESLSAKESGEDQPENLAMKYSGRFFRDHLNLSRDQMALFTEFNPRFRQQVRDINIGLAEIRRQMLADMSADESDTARLELLSDSVGLLHADLKKLTYRYYLNFKEICDKTQQEKLEQLFGEMFATDVQVGQYGKGAPYGRGRGRQVNK